MMQIDVYEDNGQIRWTYTGVALPERSNNGVSEVLMFDKWYSTADIMSGAISFAPAILHNKDYHSEAAASPYAYVFVRKEELYWYYTGEKIRIGPDGTFLLCGCVTTPAEFIEEIQIDPCGVMFNKVPLGELWGARLFRLFAILLFVVVLSIMIGTVATLLVVGLVVLAKHKVIAVNGMLLVKLLKRNT